MIFVSGVPDRIDYTYFKSRYGQNFPALTNTSYESFVESVIDDVYTMYAGVGRLWDTLAQKTWYDKTRLCYGLLVAWYITDLYPDFSVGVATSAGIPLESKKIDGITLHFQKDAKGTDYLSGLKSNSFGNKAYQMIHNSGKVFYIYGGRK